MKYSIVIVTKDRLDALKRLLESIEKHTKDYELIVVNDASTDGTTDWLDKQGVRYGHYSVSDAPFQSISYTSSIPVAIAWNLGCEVAKGEFLQILNDDMEVTDGWLDSQAELYEYLSSLGKKVGVFAAKLIRGEEVLSRGGAFRGTQLVPVPGPEEVKQVSYSNTPFLKRELWKKLGGFDAMAHIYYEDANFCLKAQKAGFINYYNPMSVIKHETLGFLPEHGEKEVQKRQHNETVVQQEARENFMKIWKDYLENEHENLY